MKLTEQEKKKLVEKFSGKGDLHIRYDVVDCEHYGDVNSALYECQRYLEDIEGSRIGEVYWDGHDCGEAYVECIVPSSCVVKLYEDEFFDMDYHYSLGR